MATFLDLISYYPSWERSFAPSGIFGDDSLRDTLVYIIRLETNESFSEGHFFIGDVANVLCSLARNETCFVTFSRTFCVTRSQLRIREDTSIVVSRCLRLPSGTPVRCPHRPHHEQIPPFRGLLFPVKICRCCREVKCKRSVGGLFFVSFEDPNFRPIAEHL